MATSRSKRRRRKTFENAVLGLAVLGIYGWLHYSDSARTQTWAFLLGLVAGYVSLLLILKAEARGEQTGPRRHAAAAILFLGMLGLAPIAPGAPASYLAGLAGFVFLGSSVREYTR